MRSHVTIRRFSSLPEAMACASYLTAHGLDPAIDEFQHATVQWYLIPALNGIGVSVPATQEESAQHLLHCVDTGEASLANEGYEQPRAYGRLGAWLYLLIPMGLITLPLMLLLLPFVTVQLISGAILPENPDEFAELALVLAEFIFALFLAWALISFYLNTRRFLKKRNQEQSSQ